MKLFIFAIGGTGARVLRSLTMLLASGVKLNSEIEIVPIIIDMDANNGDTLRAMNLINGYKQIREKSYPAKSANGYFHTNIRTLGSLAKDAAGQNNGNLKIQDSFQFDFGNLNQTFFNYIQAAGLNDDTSKLLDALFDNSPEKNGSKASTTELNLQLSLGFKGNPNIGSIVFNNIKNTDEFKYFESVFSHGDKIMIISSIFGGTGSSGFPVLVKNFRNSNKVDIKNADIGALVVMPYFKINTDEKASAIDSNNFNSKTKAALSYYASELDGKINATYYIGLDEAGLAYDNSEGGQEQKNKAHLIEMISATGVINYANRAIGITEYYEFGIPFYRTSMDFRHFDEYTKQNIFLPLASFSYFAKLYKEVFPTGKALDSAFGKSLGLTRTKFSSGAYAILTSFVEEYILWLQELKTNEPSFFPVDLNANYKMLIQGHEIKTGWASRFDEQSFLAPMAKSEKANSVISDDYQRFMKSCYEAISKIMEEKVPSLPSGANL